MTLLHPLFEAQLRHGHLPQCPWKVMDLDLNLSRDEHCVCRPVFAAIEAAIRSEASAPLDMDDDFCPTCHRKPGRPVTTERLREICLTRFPPAPPDVEALRDALEAIVAWWDAPLPGVPYLDGMVIRIDRARAALAATGDRP